MNIDDLVVRRCSVANLTPQEFKNFMEQSLKFTEIHFKLSKILNIWDSDKQNVVIKQLIVATMPLQSSKKLESRLKKLALIKEVIKEGIYEN